MPQAGLETPLVQEAATDIRSRDVEDLEGVLGLQVEVSRPVDVCHPPLAQRRHDHVAVEHLASL